MISVENLEKSRLEEIEKRWADESEERIDAVNRNEMGTVDGDIALKELRALLNRINSFK